MAQDCKHEEQNRYDRSYRRTQMEKEHIIQELKERGSTNLSVLSDCTVIDFLAAEKTCIRLRMVLLMRQNKAARSNWRMTQLSGYLQENGSRLYKRV